MSEKSTVKSVFSCQKHGFSAISVLTKKWSSDVGWLDDVFGRAESAFSKKVEWNHDGNVENDRNVENVDEESQDSEPEILLPAKKTIR